MPNGTGKPVIHSKTLIVNVLTLLVAILGGQFGIELPAEWAVPALAVVNILLRFVTNAPISGIV